MEDRFTIAFMCAEYDHAAVVSLIDNKPVWTTTPQRVHIAASLAEAEAAGAFIRTAYTLSDGCRDDLLHGDLIEEDA